MAHWSYTSQDYKMFGMKGTTVVTYALILAYTIFTASWFSGGIFLAIFSVMVFVAKRTQTQIGDVLPLMINRYIGKKRKPKPFVDYRNKS